MSRGAWSRYDTAGSPHYDVVMPGFKYNMMDLQAAIGLHQLKGLEARLRRVEQQDFVRDGNEHYKLLPNSSICLCTFFHVAHL
jgi:hypothetical protein